MFYSVLLTVAVWLSISSHALPQLPAESDEVSSSTGKEKNWFASSDSSVEGHYPPNGVDYPPNEGDYLLSTASSEEEERDLQTANTDNDLADRAEIAAVYSRYIPKQASNNNEVLFDQQIYAVFIEEYRETELVRRFVSKEIHVETELDDAAPNSGQLTWEISTTEPLPDGGAMTEEQLIESYERLAEFQGNNNLLIEQLEIWYDFDQLPAFEYKLWVDTGFSSDPFILHGSGWQVMLGRKARYEIEGVWRPKSKEEATISPYQPIRRLRPRPISTDGGVV